MTKDALDLADDYPPNCVLVLNALTCCWARFERRRCIPYGPPEGNVGHIGTTPRHRREQRPLLVALSITFRQPRQLPSPATAATYCTLRWCAHQGLRGLTTTVYRLRSWELSEQRAAIMLCPSPLLHFRHHHVAKRLRLCESVTQVLRPSLLIMHGSYSSTCSPATPHTAGIDLVSRRRREYGQPHIIKLHLDPQSCR